MGKTTILDRMVKTLGELFDEILIVTRKPQEYSDYPVSIVTDIYDDRSSLTGIHSGLHHAKNRFSFVAPCDAPFLQPQFIRFMIDSIEPENDVVIPWHGGHYEPLCAVYSKRCIPIIEEQLSRKNYRIYDFFENVNMKKIDIGQITTVDPAMLSFFNVNTPDALASSMKVMEERKLF